MQSPKKSWVCNLNHAHLQHISLGLHLSRHPELQDDGHSLAPGRQGGCKDCRDHGGGTLEEVDANSNNPSLPCRCCDSHLLRLDDKLGLRGHPLLPSRPALKAEEDEDLGSPSEPSDPASSSASSCSELSLDESPVSVYFRELPTAEASSPEHQPNIVPLEDARYVAGCGERGPDLSAPRGERPLASRVRDSPDSLCSSGSLGSLSDTSSPGPESPVEPPPAGSLPVPPRPVLPPARPCRAPPAVPAPRVGPELDSNCNTLPARGTACGEGSPSAPLDVNLNRAWVSSGPPPVPPRTKRGLLGLKRGDAGKPAPAAAPPPAQPEPPLGHDSLPGDGGRKTVTSFHELAQKRKRAAAVPPAPAPQARQDQSDWLIVFSPDTELPPCNELTCGGPPLPADPPIPLQEPSGPAGRAQRGVTTFKELRHRKQKGGPPAAQGGAAPLPPQTDPAKGVPDGGAAQELDRGLPPSGPFWAPKETQPRRKTSRPGLQPIVEGGLEDGEDAGAEQDPPAGGLAGASHRRDPWMPGRAGRGGRCDAEGLAIVELIAAELSGLEKGCSLEGVALTSPAPPGPAFCPRLQTLSCEEVCLLADKRGQVLGTLSPEELLPIRLSPIGAYSPPARSVLPFLESPDLAVLFSPLFPRSRTFPALAFPTRQVPRQRFGAPAPLGKQAGAGPGRVSWDNMGTTESGPPRPLRQSQSFGGVPTAGSPWRADAGHVSAQLREQKKALLVAVSASVDKIVAHFSTAKNLVQKAQLGDSRLSPEVGYLVLGTLCPALRALVGDGLKPFQKDVITGQRPSSPWSVVEASAKPGPHTRSVNALYWRVSRLAPLRNNQQRFHAFILGLLNMKQLEQWFSHLQQNSDLIAALYVPTAFLVLSRGFCRRWAEELLLLLQPLSTLTFQLDLLFEYHHLSLDVRPMAQQALTPAGSWKARGSSCLDWAGRRALPLPVAGLEEGPLAQSSPRHEPPEGVPLHQRLLQWGDRFTHTLRGSEAPSKGGSGPPGPQPEAEDKRSWWEQIGRASEVYVDAFPAASKQGGLPTSRWSRLRVALGEAVKEARLRAGRAAVGSSAPLQPPKPEDSGPAAARLAASKPTGSSAEGRAVQEPGGSTSGAGAGAVSPTGTQRNETPDSEDPSGSGKGTWLGWLFGANSPGASGCSPEPDPPGMPRSSRRPSSWLPPTVNVLALVMKTAPAEKSWPEESWEDTSPDLLQPYRAVRALCDHAGTGDAHLSFRKGDILQVLDTVDEDWIRCCHGDSKGLVPVSYTSLIL
ncbi:hypothetical protein lerEdw1_002913 [Lerista edwardsae]|nr:hypothetical protein lerEdw1_002913 [Lerista edwardsae]